jgi:hypothetical protein
LRPASFSWLFALALVMAAWAGCGLAADETAPTLKFEPEILKRTLFTSLTHELTIIGTIPENSEVVLKIVGPDRSYRLNKSGKGLGFVWLPVGHAEVRDIPGMYAILSSVKIADAVSPAAQEAAGLVPGFQEVFSLSKVHFEKAPKKDEAPALNQAYVAGMIQILRDKGLYQERTDAVSISACQFTAKLHHPATAPLGEYKVFCYSIMRGKVQLISQGSFLVESEGIVAWLAKEAQANAGIYGVLAAVVAVVAGLLAGLVFRSGGAH